MLSIINAVLTCLSSPYVRVSPVKCFRVPQVEEDQEKKGKNKCSGRNTAHPLCLDLIESRLCSSNET
jgi:hypothetical protein